jgi:type III pantothenate kinase
MLLLLDIGNTHTHAGLSNHERVLWQRNARTAGWPDGSTARELERMLARRKIEGACFCSVVPKASGPCREWLEGRGIPFVELNSSSIRGVGVDYPRPRTIGADRLANAVAAKARYGAPAVVVDFGTAVTFDVVDRRGNYAGGIIAPGLSLMTHYLHEKTALLPKIKIREVRAVVGKNTREAMLIGAVHGYRGLVHALILELKKELGARRLPVVATGGYAALIAKGLPEITAVDSNLTLDGLRLVWRAHASARARTSAPAAA